MKKLIFLILLLTLSIIGKSQYKLILTSGSLELQNANGTLRWGCKPISSVKVKDSINNVLIVTGQTFVEDLFVIKVATFTVNGVSVTPITMANIIDSVNFYKAITVGGAGTAGGGGGTATDANQIAANAIAQKILDSTIKANIERRLQTKIFQDSITKLIAKPFISDSNFVKVNTDTATKSLAELRKLNTSALKVIDSLGNIITNQKDQLKTLKDSSTAFLVKATNIKLDSIFIDNKKQIDSLGVLIKLNKDSSTYFLTLQNNIKTDSTNIRIKRLNDSLNIQIALVRLLNKELTQKKILDSLTASNLHLREIRDLLNKESTQQLVLAELTTLNGKNLIVESSPLNIEAILNDIKANQTDGNQVTKLRGADGTVADVGNLPNAKPLKTLIVDGNGNQITSFGATATAPNEGTRTMTTANSSEDFYTSGIYKSALLKVSNFTAGHLKIRASFLTGFDTIFVFNQSKNKWQSRITESGQYLVNITGLQFYSVLTSSDFAGTVTIKTSLLDHQIPFPTPSSSSTSSVVDSFQTRKLVSVDTIFKPVTVILNKIKYDLSTGNNTAANLGIGAVFNGAVESVIDAPNIIVSALVNQNYTLTINQYGDAAGTILVSTKSFTRLAGQPLNVSVTAYADFYKIVITNTSGVAATQVFAKTYTGILAPTPDLTNNGNFPVELQASNNVIGQVTANAGTNLNTSALNLEATQLLIKAKTDNLDVPLSTRTKPTDNQQVNQTLATAGFEKITDGTNTVSVKAASTASVATDNAFVITNRPQNSTMGAVPPVVTSISSTLGLSFTNPIEIILENTGTTATTCTYGGVSMPLAVGSQRIFSSFYDVNKKVYSPLLAVVVNGTATATVVATVTTIQ